MKTLATILLMAFTLSVSAQMSVIDTGAVANDGTGDALRDAFIKVVQNFDGISNSIIPDYIVSNESGTYYARSVKDNGKSTTSGAVFHTLFNALVDTNISVFVLRGTYTLTSPLLIENVVNFKLQGEEGTDFVYHATTATNLELINLQGVLTDIEISGISFSQTDTLAEAPTNSEGMICTNAASPVPQFTNIYIHDCEFTCPNANINGIFMNIQQATALLNGIRLRLTPVLHSPTPYLTTPLVIILIHLLR